MVCYHALSEWYYLLILIIALFFKFVNELEQMFYIICRGVCYSEVMSSIVSLLDCQEQWEVYRGVLEDKYVSNGMESTHNPH